MGYLGGFAVTFRQRGRKQRVTLEYAKDEGGKRPPPPHAGQGRRRSGMVAPISSK